MAQITGGTVSIEDGVKHAGYDDPQFAPQRRVRVELRFEASEGESGEDALDRASLVAANKVINLLGGRAAKPTPEAVHAANLTPTTAVTAEAHATERKKPGPKPRTPTPAPTQASQPAADPAAVSEEQIDKLPASEAAAVVEEDDLNFDAPAEAVAEKTEITDAELVSAATHKAGELKTGGGVRIRQLVGTFKPASMKPEQQFQLREIAQEQRADFLAKLKALKAE